LKDGWLVSSWVENIDNYFGIDVRLGEKENKIIIKIMNVK
jgi:hypothetical protein